MATSDSAKPVAGKQARTAAYKTLLRHYIDQRPSGLRQKLAQLLGTHKSFISQITNPNDPTPIPARHLDTIIDSCHLSQSERSQFLEAYRQAHPRQRLATGDNARHYKTLHVQIPVLEDPDRQQALELFIRDTVRRLCGLVDT